MKYYDAIVIGGGILGCFTARNLRRWNISVCLLEKERDVCTGITRANSAVVYAGYDNKPGSLKAAMTVRGNARMEEVCRELEVPFSRCGSLLVTYDADSVPKMERKFRNGIKNGVPGIRLLSGPEAEAIEPMLRPGVVAALLAPSTGTVNPWQLGIAAYENALQNGAEAAMNEAVRAISRTDDGFLVETERESYSCKMVFNCAGLSADHVQELAFEPSVRLELDSAEYLVLDENTEKPGWIIFHQASSCGKGITAIPCVEGNLLISGFRKPLGGLFATTAEGLRELHDAAHGLLPKLDLKQVIRSFGAVRPNPHRTSGESIHDFCIENPAPGFYSLIGIKTPGLTCADQLGLHLAKEAAAHLGASENTSFDPRRPAIRRGSGPDYYEIVCQCGQITRGEILDAIARGASTIQGVKHRVGATMGPCQGGRCIIEIAKILKETGANPNALYSERI